MDQQTLIGMAWRKCSKSRLELQSNDGSSGLPARKQLKANRHSPALLVLLLLVLLLVQLVLMVVLLAYLCYWYHC